MKDISKRMKTLVNHPIFPIFILITIALTMYYKFIFLGKIPFPGDLLVGSYSPWFDYYKIPVQNPLISDVFSQFFLWKYLAIDSFLKLQWPLWNTHSLMGTPLLATYHSATLYPLNLFLLLPKYAGWGIFIFSQTLIALVNMYILLFYWTKSKIPAMLGAVIFGFGGLMTTWLELGTAVHAVAWLPLCIYAVELFLSKYQFRYLILLTFELVLIILAGNAQVTTYSFIIVSLYYVIQSWNSNLKKFLLKIFYLFLTYSVAILWSAVQLFPSFSLLQKSIRLTESYTAELNFGLLNLKDAIRFFIADFLGNPVTRNFWGNFNYSETSGFIGTLTFPFIIYSFLFLKKTRLHLSFLLLLIFSLILAFDNPLSHLIYQSRIPLLTSSYASRILFVSTLAISILSAFSLNQIIKDRKEINNLIKTNIWSLAIILGVIVGTLISKFTIWNIINLESNAKQLQYLMSDRDYLLNNFNVAIKNSFLPLALESSFLFFLIIINKFRTKAGKQSLLLCITILMLTSLDLGRYFLKFNPFVSANLIFPKTPALDFLQKQPGSFRVGREHAETLPPNTWIAYNLDSYEGYDPIYLSQYGKFMHFLNGGDVRTGNSSRYAEVSSNYSSPYLDAANTKFFIAILRDNNGRVPGDLLNFQVKNTHYNLIFKDKSAAILENPQSLERIYFAPSILNLTESKIMDLMMTDKIFDPRKEIALSKNLGISSVTGKGSIKNIIHSDNFIKFNTETSTNEVLIVADQYEDGWKAKLDSKEILISPANLIFRAIKVPAGNHEVIFYYWPKSFDIGLKVSLVTTTLILLFSLLLIKLKKF
ncbi:YfhO family protein [Candidatus Daviesbacteria bacterium]|nr:YfhO family protein [Candidatus Daviesbacteria bacterium]